MMEHDLRDKHDEYEDKDEDEDDAIGHKNSNMDHTV